MRTALLLLAFASLCLPTRLWAQNAAERELSRSFLDAFLITERAKLIDRVQREGDRFDAQRTFENLDRKHEKVFGTRMSEAMIAEFQNIIREAAALPPDPDAGNRRSATDSDPVMFMANARIKFLEDIREEGDKFNLQKEYSEYSQRFERNFGMPMPADLQEQFFRNADLARSALQVERATGASTVNNAAPPPVKPQAVLLNSVVAGRGPRYPAGLPSWFQSHDRNQDGQVALYEWERDRLAEFKTWDLNGDGLIEPTEVLRRLQPATATNRFLPLNNGAPIPGGSPLYATTRVAIEILKAEYGAQDQKKDVTAILQRQVGNSSQIPLPAGDYNASFGGDPASGRQKELKIWYRINGRSSEAIFRENEPISLRVP